MVLHCLSTVPSGSRMQLVLAFFVHFCVLQVLGQTNLDSLKGCNIKREFITVMNNANFEFPDFPRIYIDEQYLNSKLTRIVSRENLLTNHGDMEVRLSSSNTYSHGLRKMPLRDYITEWVDKKSVVQSNSTVHANSSNTDPTDYYSSPTTISANESFYLFGNNYDGIFSEVNAQYVTPPCKYCEKGGAKTIGIGGARSGVSFHFHGFGFSEAIIGTKQWFLFPPALTPIVSKFSPNLTVSQWVSDIYPILTRLRNVGTVSTSSNEDSDVRGVKYRNSSVYRDVMVDGESRSSDAFTLYTVNDNSSSSSCSSMSNTPHIESEEASVTQQHSLVLDELYAILTPSEWQQLADNLYECIIHPGEVLYFPNYWMHATLNLDEYNVFYSLFLDPQLMKD